MLKVYFTSKLVFRILLLHSLLLFATIQIKAQDSDRDGTENAKDTDDDNDGITDVQEAFLQLTNYKPGCTGIMIPDFSAPAALVTGTEKTVGAVYRIPNVLTEMDALVQIEMLENVTTITIDDNTSRAAALQPITTVKVLVKGTEAFAQYKITFVTKGTTTPANISTIYANFADIDGNPNSIGDIVYIGDHSAYTLQQPTTMNLENSVYAGGVNWTKVTASTNEVNGLDTLNKSVMITAKFSNVSSFRIRVGAVSRGAGNDIGRPSRIDFGCVVNYATPNTYVLDFDEDGYHNVVDQDSDNDGMEDLFETFAANNDGDANPDFLDIDSDNDGITDLIESQLSASFKPLKNEDTDKDGIDDALDAFVGTDGSGLKVAPANTDNLDTPDYIDLDSDNDTQLDALEGWDSDNDGVANTLPSGTDSDRDGLDNGFDKTPLKFTAGDNQTLALFPNSGGGAERDWREPYIEKPIANPDNLTATEDIVLKLIAIYNNDIRSDDGPSATAPFTILTPPAHGNVTVKDNGTPVLTDDTLIYTPALNYNGPDSFIYQVCDLTNDCDTALVNIVVAPANDKPVAMDEFASTDPSVPVTITAGTNDTDVDAGNVFTYSIISKPSGSKATVEATTGVITYTPASDNARRQDSVVYSVCDNGTPQLCDNGLVLITVPNIIITPEDIQALIKVSNASKDPASVAILVNPKNGVASVNNKTGEITYAPSLNYNGNDSLRYKICGLSTPCDSSWILISVSPVNDIPTVISERLNTQEDVLLSGDLTGPNDADLEGTALTATETIANPKHGTLTLKKDGTFDYTPAVNYNGLDTAIVKVCDQGLPLPAACANDTIFITVVPVNDAPIAKEVISNADPAIATPIPLAGSVSDADAGTVFTYSVISNPPNTTATIDAAKGVITYTSLPDATTRTDIVRYRVCDNGVPALCSEANILIAIPDRSFRAKNDAAIMDEDNAASVSVLVNDTAFHKVDSSKLAVIVQPRHGKATVDSKKGLVIYTPDVNFNGQDTLQYTICTAVAPQECKTAVVSFTVNPINDLNVISNIFVAGIGDVPVKGNFVTNNIDPENTGITAGNLIKGSEFGDFTFSANGDFTYTPFEDAPSVNDLVVVEVCDNGSPLPGLCKNDTILFTIKQYLFISEGFTPNGDGLNDNFIVETLISGNIDVKMYNRWGGLIYANSNYKSNWNGIANEGLKIGETLSEGTYFYEIKFGNGEVKRNYITILK